MKGDDKGGKKQHGKQLSKNAKKRIKFDIWEKK
jgi:hypothetical protein